MYALIPSVVNVLILVGIMVYFLRGPVREFVSGRSTGLRDEVVRVQAQLRDAEQKYTEFSAKLQAIDAEVVSLREQVRQDAEAMRVKTVAEAKRLAGSILVDAKDSSQSLYGDLKNQLRTELSGQVLDRAEKILKERLTGEDKLRIRREFSQQVESVQ
ncbi:MAG: ATP synthase F0 subunit B [Methylotenera sp.]|nr:ATP synthase F0 subunit B [Oligoflexia bacterium]